MQNSELGGPLQIGRGQRDEGKHKEKGKVHKKN